MEIIKQVPLGSVQSIGPHPIHRIFHKYVFNKYTNDGSKRRVKKNPACEELQQQKEPILSENE